jgi:hypothetical protein
MVQPGMAALLGIPSPNPWVFRFGPMAWQEEEGRPSARANGDIMASGGRLARLPCYWLKAANAGGPGAEHPWFEVRGTWTVQCLWWPSSLEIWKIRMVERWNTGKIVRCGHDPSVPVSLYKLTTE